MRPTEGVKRAMYSEPTRESRGTASAAILHPSRRSFALRCWANDPFYRERLWQRLKEWQRLHKGALSDKELAAVDLALWDLAGRALNLPVHKLLGATRDKVPAYASTMCGDDLKDGLDTPEAFAAFALR